MLTELNTFSLIYIIGSHLITPTPVPIPIACFDLIAKTTTTPTTATIPVVPETQSTPLSTANNSTSTSTSTSPNPTNTPNIKSRHIWPALNQNLQLGRVNSPVAQIIVYSVELIRESVPFLGHIVLADIAQLVGPFDPNLRDVQGCCCFGYVCYP
ncbi:hypothetical protein BDW75DRAFT_210955 [Aspergillus navahoensis]